MRLCEREHVDRGSLADFRDLNLGLDAAPIWFENWGDVDPGERNSLLRQILQNNRFFRANFREISIFSGNFTKNSIFQGKFPKNFNFLCNFTKKFDLLQAI